jgi:hypothetical protein
MGEIMKNLSEAATSKKALAMSIEDWFDKYGVEILKREETKWQLDSVASGDGITVEVWAMAATVGK